MHQSVRAASLVLAAVAAFALAGCGVNGKPEVPAGATMVTTTKPDGSTGKRPAKPTRPFVLDGLLN